MRYKIADIDNERYYVVPKSLFTYPKYRVLSIGSRIIYCILKDHLKLSRENNWVDENNNIYLMFSYAKLAAIMGVDKSRITRYTQELEKVGLLDIVRPANQGQLHLNNRIYLRGIDVPANINNISNAEDELTLAEVSEPRFQNPNRILE